MNKDNHSILQDENLREALRQDEAALPEMPADLNDRLMKRLHHEERHRHYRVWPLVAAACVAALMMVWLLPPRGSSNEAMTDSGELATQKSSLATERGANIVPQETKGMESSTTAQDGRMANPDTRDRRMANSTERTERIANPDIRCRRIANSTEQAAEQAAEQTEVLLAQEEAADHPKEVTASSEMVPTDLPRTQAKPQQVVLTERDIPISHPENYRYTPEELALMRRQANEAYVKWMELDLEIIKYQFEQIAKQ